MGLTKIEYSTGDTLTAEQVNEMQDAIIKLEIGTAPAGYVENFFDVNTIDEFNSKVAELESAMEVRTIKHYAISKKSHENEFPSGDYLVEIDKSYHGFSTATAKGIHNGIKVILHRVLFENVWGEWEWENPILYWGVEYRTTEKWDGKPVYTKWVSHTPTTDIGNASGSYGFAIEFSTPNFKRLIRYGGSLNVENGNALPYFDAVGGYLGVNYMNNNGVAIAMNKKVIRAGTTINVQIWYTKE